MSIKFCDEKGALGESQRSRQRGLVFGTQDLPRHALPLPSAATAGLQHGAAGVGQHGVDERLGRLSDRLMSITERLRSLPVEMGRSVDSLSSMAGQNALYSIDGDEIEVNE